MAVLLGAAAPSQMSKLTNWLRPSRADLPLRPSCSCSSLPGPSTSGRLEEVGLQGIGAGACLSRHTLRTYGMERASRGRRSNRRTATILASGAAGSLGSATGGSGKQVSMSAACCISHTYSVQGYPAVKPEA
eukprot:1157624-Pelagomonas_calceolata.AAC.6